MNIAEQFPDCKLWVSSRGWTVVCDRPGASIEMTSIWGGHQRAEICRHFAPRQPIPWPWGMGSAFDVVAICEMARLLADTYLSQEQTT